MKQLILVAMLLMLAAVARGEDDLTQRGILWTDYDYNTASIQIHGDTYNLNVDNGIITLKKNGDVIFESDEGK